MQITDELMRDIQQQVGGGGGGGESHSSVGPHSEASGSLQQQERRTAHLTGSEAELLLQLEEEKLQVCADDGTGGEGGACHGKFNAQHRAIRL